jgi:aminopeptidase N
MSNPPPLNGSASVGDAYLPTSGNEGYAAVHYEIDLDYRVATNRLNGTATIRARALVALGRFSLDFAGLSVVKVTVNGERPRKLAETPRKLTITPEQPLGEGEEFEVVVRYRGAPHPIRSTWGEVGWEELADGVLVAGQPSGAASWFPCNDHPSDKATYRISVACESPYTVVSNGVLSARTTRSGRTTWTYDMAQPMATYLATVQIGRYRKRELANTPVPQTLYYPARNEPEALVDFARLPDMMGLFCELFGPYPFDSYAAVVTADELEIPLEAQGMAIFGCNHVDGAHGSDRLIAHELAHQWFGNSLTVGLWRDIWLHEGFACYAEWLWSEASGGRTAQENASVHRSRVDALPKDILVGDPGPQGMFDDRVYKRGALALHAVRVALGDTAFFDALRAYTSTRRYGTVSTEDFVEFFMNLTGNEKVPTIIDRWISSKSLPRI